MTEYQDLSKIITAGRDKDKYAWLTAQVPFSLALEARKAAAARNISRSEFIRQAVEEFLHKDKNIQ